ncbi:MAG: hypothetical protein JJ909_16590 [Roseivirga sp.]|uniref:hypothetical protein n=1 Tax=Roseivirga sp. TaxID=1964215 RepID=UPI001B2BFB68|nr:hypothetical protein [Roseivirga sp.]MBO6661261.1 hypothetical protein [Roseivirga sp.]MBO6762576.1 hypothetical protein [Roseivirga sp.]MBO6908755.1 hypothetical protein [Roseivirga sp.]
MFFSKPKPTVTPEDKEWIEDAFLWLEEQYGREYLKTIRIIEPTKKIFDHEFNGTEEDAHFALSKCLGYMDIKSVDVKLYFFNEAPMTFEGEGAMITQQEEGHGSRDNFALGKYSETGPGSFEIGIERNQLKNVQSLISTIAHELSHLILLGEGRLQENDEELTDLNCIALGFGIFIGNSIFDFRQWQGTTHNGWEAQRRGYIPEEVASYAMALFNKYQNNQTTWTSHLNKGIKKMFEKNLNYLNSNEANYKFK